MRRRMKDGKGRERERGRESGERGGERVERERERESQKVMKLNRGRQRLRQVELGAD